MRAVDKEVATREGMRVSTVCIEHTIQTDFAAEQVLKAVCGLMLG